MKEDDDGNALTTVKPDVAAVLQNSSPVSPSDITILIDQNIWKKCLPSLWPLAVSRAKVYANED